MAWLFRRLIWWLRGLFGRRPEPTHRPSLLTAQMVADHAVAILRANLSRHNLPPIEGPQPDVEYHSIAGSPSPRYSPADRMMMFATDKGVMVWNGSSADG